MRLFIEFVTQPFRDIEQQRKVRVPSTAMPHWAKAPRPRASTTIGR